MLAALLLAGGCARQRLASDEAKLPAVTSPAATHTPPPTTGPAAPDPAVAQRANATHSTTDSDVDALLGDIDKLLASDSSLTEDQD
jgi:hypothetical protein